MRVLMPNHPTAANPAITLHSSIERESRRVAEWNRSAEIRGRAWS